MTRVAGKARTVLAGALFFAAFAVGPAYARSTPTVHLEPARMFSPFGDSLFALHATKGSVANALFNVVATDQLLAATVSSTTAEAVRLPWPIAQRLVVPSSGVPISNVTPLSALANFQTDGVLSASTAQDPVAPAIGSAATAPAVAPATAASAPVRFGAFQAYTPALQAFTQGDLSAPLLQLRAGAFDTMQRCGTTDQAAPCALASSSGTEFVASTGMMIRAAGRPINLQFSGSIQNLVQGPAATFPYVAMDPDPQFDPAKVDADAPMLSYPGITTMLKHGVGASVAVPVTPRLTLGLQYDLQHYQAQYGLTDLSLDARKSTYGGGLSYQLPHTNGLITLSARQYRYQNALDPDFALTQTRADLNFTVKF